MRHICLTIIVVVGCSRAPVEPGDFRTRFDTSSASEIFQQDQNPVGLLVAQHAEHAMKCTTVLTTSGYFLTNAHCLSDDGAFADEVEINLKTPSGYTRQTKVQRIVNHSYQGQRDWMVLAVDNTEALLDVFGGIEFSDFRLSRPEGEKSIIDLTVITIDPGGRRGPAKLTSKTGHLQASHWRDVVERRVTIVDQIKLHHGNSGSPVLYEGKLIGIVSHIVDGQMAGLMQSGADIQRRITTR